MKTDFGYHLILVKETRIAEKPTLDPLRDEAMEYARRLMQAGVRTDLHVFGGTCHGFDSLHADWEVSGTLFTLQSDALRRAFGAS